MFVKLAQFLNIMLYTLVAGVMWGTWLSLGRTMTEYDAATFLADGKHMITNLATVMPVLMIATGVLSLVVVILLFRRGATAAAWVDPRRTVGASRGHRRDACGRGSHRQPSQDVDDCDPASGLGGDPVPVGELPHAAYIPVAGGSRRRGRGGASDRTAIV